MNLLYVAINSAVERGVSEQTIAMLLLFPLVAALVAFSRQVIGLVGFGMLIPVLVTAAFLSTGVFAGLLLFLLVLGTATVARLVLKRIRIPYLPRLAMVVWSVSLVTLLILLVAPSLSIDKLASIGIFPILLMVMLAESFVETQITRTWSTAALMTAETLGIALLGYGIVTMPVVQNFALTNPFWTVLLTLLLDYLIGRYKGLRIMEVWRFRKIIVKNS